MVKIVIGSIIAFVALSLFCYAPAIFWHRKTVIAKHDLDNKLIAIRWNNFVITDKLGEGGSQNSGDKFADTQKNRNLATESTLWLMRRYMG